MPDSNPTTRFVLTSLPRCGSTNLARLLNSHTDINCILEPFHPKRYGGIVNYVASDELSTDLALEFLWTKWNGIKHVWEANGWPFADAPRINDRLSQGQNVKTIFLVRKNLLRRFISNYICRHTRFWVGNKEDFLKHFASAQFTPLTSAAVSKHLHLDRAEIARKGRFLSCLGARSTTVYYEDIFDQPSNDDKLRMVNSLLCFLNFEPLSPSAFNAVGKQYLDREKYQWSSPEIYSRLPGIAQIEADLGSDETGWLFK
jgi:hypothetical protein